jgi:hypothetical protein
VARAVKIDLRGQFRLAKCGGDMTLCRQMQHNIGFAHPQLGLKRSAGQNIGGGCMNLICVSRATIKMVDHPGGDKTAAAGQKYTFLGHLAVFYTPENMPATSGGRTGRASVNDLLHAKEPGARPERAEFL